MTSDVLTASGAEASGRARRQRHRTVVRLLLALVALWLAAVGTTAALAALDLYDAREALTAAERQLRAADLSAAQAELTRAVEHAERSSSRLHALHLSPLRATPVVAPNLRAVATLSDAARDVGGAGAEVLAAAADIVHGEDDAALGELSTAYLRQLAPPLRRLTDELTASTAAVSRADAPSLFGPIARARESYLGMVEPVLDRAVVAADVAEVMPVFLGADRPRTYLLGAGALSELRGSGGLLGSLSLMHVDDGRIRIEEFVDVAELEGTIDVPRVDAPSAAYAARYASRGGLQFWRNANLSADFPATAEVLLELWERDGRRALDGVIVADAVAYERIVARSGPMEIPGVTTLTAENTRRFVGLDAYAAFEDDAERKQVLGAVAASAFGRLLEVLEDDDVPATVEMLTDLAHGGHLQVFARDEAVQDALVAAGVAGALPTTSGEFGAVVVNNVAGNKVDVFTSRTTEHRIELLPGGRTRAELTVGFRNAAPTDGLPRHVLGPWAEGVEAGDNVSLVTLLCGRGCEVTQPPDGARDGGTERGLTATDVWLRVPAGQERSVSIETVTSDSWRELDGELELHVGHRQQPTITDDHLRVTVAVPDGFAVAVVPDGAVVTSDEVVWETGEQAVDRTLRYRFVPAG